MSKKIICPLCFAMFENQDEAHKHSKVTYHFGRYIMEDKKGESMMTKRMSKIIINDEEWEVCPNDDQIWKENRGFILLGSPRFVTLLIRPKKEKMR